MRYQQKVMQNNTQKKIDMYGYEDSQQKLLTSSLGAGKVRAMFDERRNRITAGIDKSYLLEPIAVDTTKATKTQRQIIAPSKSSRDQKMTNYTKVIVPPLQGRVVNHEFSRNSGIPINETRKVNLKSEDSVLVNFKQTTSSKLPTKSNAVNDKNGSNSDFIRKPVANTSTSAPLKNVTNQKPSPSRSMNSGSSASSSTSSRSTLHGSAKPIGMKDKVQSAKTIQQNNSHDEDDGPVPEGLVRCPICKRNFAEDRIEKHKVICQKTKTKKRKIYDSSKKRVQGTEAETYNKKPLTRVAPKSATVQPKSNSSNWRAKHDDFIKTIRAAKEMQAYIAKGGKLTDLPPPPPSVNPDYVQCPHCSRRFNEAAANRHIPICQNINKPKSKPGNIASKTSGSIKRR